MAKMDIMARRVAQVTGRKDCQHYSVLVRKERLHSFHSFGSEKPLLPRLCLQNRKDCEDGTLFGRQFEKEVGPSRWRDKLA